MSNQHKLAQFHFASQDPIKTWVKQLSLKNNKCVIEIGPGKGEITTFLAEICKELKAIEYDQERKDDLSLLEKKYSNLKVFYSDFTKFTIFDDDYIVVSNIPFNLTRKIFENLLFQKFIPISIYLILQKEVVAKICQQKKSHLLAIFLQTFYQTRPHMKFKRNDFIPTANVDVQAIEMHKVDIESTRSDRKKYFKLLTTAFETSEKPLKAKFKKIISYKQIKILFKEFNFSEEIKPQEINSELWWKIYQHIKSFY